MRQLSIPAEEPTKEDLAALAFRGKAVLVQLKAPDSEVKFPIIIEFSGSPKSGKSSVIGILAHFFRRLKFEIATPAEGASVRTPSGLRDDWLSFNAWSGCYALQQILIDCSLDNPPTLLILDRGLFDVAGWMEFLHSQVSRVSSSDQEKITEFFMLDIWRRRENAVFLFTADHPTSIKREMDSKLTDESGSVMNESTLNGLRKSYEEVGRKAAKEGLEIFFVDTSDSAEKEVGFRQVAFVVADKIVGLMEGLCNQMLLVTSHVDFDGFNIEPDTVRATIAKIINGNDPHFLLREKAEISQEVQQIVPYAILEDTSGRFFWAKRRSDSSHEELRNKNTLLVGGHAEQRDWDPNEPESVFQRCLKRELDEELIGLQIMDIEALGFINDISNAMGSHHLAFIHKVKVGGKTTIRRQAIDKEFGRESVSWKTKDEIRERIVDLDPWSQLVAAKLFGAALPTLSIQNNLFRP